jgi:hypothetical protein
MPGGVYTEASHVPELARFAELISSRVSMRLLRQAGSPKQTIGLTAANSIIAAEGSTLFLT